MHHTLDLALATNNWVELSVSCSLSQVATELVKNLRTLLRCVGFSANLNRVFALKPGEQLRDLLTNAVGVCAKFGKHLRSNALTLTNQTKQKVFGADV